jgi:hypothetical protein
MRWPLIVILAVCLGAEQDQRRRPMRPAAAPTTAAAPVQQSTGLIPLTKLGGNYKGMEGGLYGGGRNEPPEALREAAMAAAGKIIPLDVAGKPSEEGKVVLLCIGMSNTTHEFSRFKEIADRDEAKSPRLVLVDGAQGGQDAADWVTDRRGRIWENVGRRLSAQDVTPEQVQVVWIKQARKGPKRLGEFPAHAHALQRDLANIVAMAKGKYPHLRLVYLSSRTYGGYSAGAVNPEPYAYESAFAVRSVINEQKLDERIPVMLWGPYLWADGTRARDDGLVWDRADFREDGTHPSESGRQKVADMLLRFFKSDAAAKPWFTKAP